MEIWNAEQESETTSQWLGDGSGMYLLEGMPVLSPEDLLRIFDVPEGKQEKWDYREIPIPLPRILDISESYKQDLEPLKTSVVYKGYECKLFKCDKEIHAVNANYLKVFSDSPEYVRFHKIKTESGAFVLGVNIGLGIQAVIFPIVLHRCDDLIGEMKEITDALVYMSRLEKQQK
jgi:hypothetical protein